MAEPFSMKELLEAGAHFGHQVRRWNPKMKQYIYTKRNGIHIIDLQKTVEMANKAYYAVKEMAVKNKKILFVCTKKQGQEAIKEAALKCNMPYVNKRWLGGLLTNFSTIQASINQFRRIERMEADGSLEKLTKKERTKLLKKKGKMEAVLGGLKDLDSLPDALFVIDTVREKIGIIEAKRLNIPVVAMVDTNSDPDVIDHPIPANDDAIRALKLFADKMSQAVIDGISESTGGETPASKEANQQAEEEKAEQDNKDAE